MAKFSASRRSGRRTSLGKAAESEEQEELAVAAIAPLGAASSEAAAGAGQHWLKQNSG